MNLFNSLKQKIYWPPNKVENWGPSSKQSISFFCLSCFPLNFPFSITVLVWGTSDKELVVIGSLSSWMGIATRTNIALSPFWPGVGSFLCLHVQVPQQRTIFVGGRDRKCDRKVWTHNGSGNWGSKWSTVNTIIWAAWRIFMKHKISPCWHKGDPGLGEQCTLCFCKGVIILFLFSYIFMCYVLCTE